MNSAQKQKVILITCASSGIGKACAEQLLSEGHIVYGLARDYENLQKIPGLHALKGDMADDASLMRVVRAIIKNEGRIDALVNNAGYGLYGAVEDVPLEAARAQFEVNLFGLARLTQLVLPHMRAVGSGRIINMSSMGGKVYFPMSAWYHATKHALEGFSDGLRLDVKEFGISVSIIEPGLIATHFGSVADSSLVKYSGKGPYRRLAHAMAKSLTKTYGNPTSISQPSVVAKAVSHAINSSRPKTRYAVGKYAKLLIFIRKYLGDRIFDRLALRQIKNNQ